LIRIKIPPKTSCEKCFKSYSLYVSIEFNDHRSLKTK
jgi:hypothetical protein